MVVCVRCCGGGGRGEFKVKVSEQVKMFSFEIEQVAALNHD